MLRGWTIYYDAPIYGEVLLCTPRRRLRLPGMPYPMAGIDAVRHTTKRLCMAMLAACAVMWLATMVMRPTLTATTCVELPDATYPVLDYRGYDNAWLYNGHIIGYSVTEDATCISPT